MTPQGIASAAEVLAVCFVVLLCVGELWRSCTRGTGRPASTATPILEIPPQASAPANGRFDEQGEARRHRRREQWYWLVTALLYTATALAAVVAANFAGSAYFQTKRQADAAEDQLTALKSGNKQQHEDTLKALDASNRPWLKVHEDVLSDLTFDDHGGAQIALQYTMHNAGHSPATDVSPAAELLICNFRTDMCGGPWPGYPSELDRVCAEDARVGEEVAASRSKPNGGDYTLMGRAVFPNDDAIIQWGAYQRDIDQLQPPPPGAPPAATMVLTCIAYGSSAEGHFYKTGHAFYLDRIGANPNVDLRSRVPIPRNQLRLRPAGDGEDYVE